MYRRKDWINGITILILLFFLFSFAGWIWEVGIHLVQDRMFVKRGVMAGPWLPIYGTGGVLMMVMLRKFTGKPLVMFFLIMGLCGCMEYVTGWFLETFYHTRWWDYSAYTFQIQGRVCLLGLFLFGTGGMIFMYLIRPRAEKMLAGISLHTREILCMMLVGIFLADLIYSLINPNQGAGISTPVFLQRRLK